MRACLHNHYAIYPRPTFLFLFIILNQVFPLNPGEPSGQFIILKPLSSQGKNPKVPCLRYSDNVLQCETTKTVPAATKH